MLRNCHYL
uniref:Uncharacterized protein n=1 Tax=Anguilla anguilla TaxID=7936 RepID=A0A0E9PSU6_ANGAN